MAPIGFNESIEGLTRRGEIRDRFAQQHIKDFARFGGGQVVARIGAIAARQTLHLIVERCIDVKQGASDIEQCSFVGFAFTADDLQHLVALLLHHAASHAQAQHAERVGHAGQRFNLRLQATGIAAPIAQVKIKFVLHPQQFFFQLSGNGIEQRAVAAGNAAAGMIEFRFARL